MLNPTHLATPEAIFETVNLALEKAQSHDFFADRRISERTTVHLPIHIQIIDQDGHPVGDAFEAITRDVSVGGIGIMSQQHIASEQVFVRFTSLDTVMSTLILDIRYCNQIGPFYFAGGSFCADWSSEEE